MYICINHPHRRKYGRCFCRDCGTSLGEILSDDDSIPINAHALDGGVDALTVTNQFHEFVKEKPLWYVIGDNAKQYMGHPV